MSEFRNLLDRARGQSQHVIVVFCDIRGFSVFSNSQGRESTDVAMLIKRFYISLLDNYFPNAQFAKPTGDGLVLVFEYTTETLHTVATTVMNGVFKCLADYPVRFFQDDPMINFSPPAQLGFGVARGSACCLLSDETRIDYSGHLLNLAARLNDYARPQGVVLDGNFLESVIPRKYRSKFRRQKVYVRSIAETEPPLEVLYTNELTVLPDYALHPMASEEWSQSERTMTLADLKLMKGLCQVDMKNKPISPSKVRVQFKCKSRLENGFVIYPYQFEYKTDSDGPYVAVHPKVALEFAAIDKLKDSDKVTFRVEYVKAPPKAGRKSKR
jgi:class 3 adenylate cyclase